MSIREGTELLQTIGGQQKDIVRLDDSLDSFMLMSE